MRKNNIVIIITTIFLYGLNRLLISFYPSGLFRLLMRGYFNDVLAGILFIAYCNIILVPRYKPLVKLWQIELLLLGCGIFWEYISPMFVWYTTSDPYDIIAYLVGGVIYYLIHKVISKRTTLHV